MSETTSMYAPDYLRLQEDKQLHPIADMIEYQIEKITKLKKALNIATRAMSKIDSSNDDMKNFSVEINQIIRETQKQIKEIMEG